MKPAYPKAAAAITAQRAAQWYRPRSRAWIFLKGWPGAASSAWGAVGGCTGMGRLAAAWGGRGAWGVSWGGWSEDGGMWEAGPVISRKSAGCVESAKHTI